MAPWWFPHQSVKRGRPRQCPRTYAVPQPLKVGATLTADPTTLRLWGIGYKEAVTARFYSRRAKMGGNMDAQALIIWLIVGAIAGWLAGMVVKGGGYGLIGDIIVGIVGGLIAGWLLPQIGIVIGGGFIAAIINAFIGAVILLIVLRLIKRAA